MNLASFSTHVLTVFFQQSLLGCGRQIEEKSSYMFIGFVHSLFKKYFAVYSIIIVLC